MFHHARAIIWAQWRALINYYSRSGSGGAIFYAVLSLAWYGLWVAGAFGAFIYMGTVKPNSESVRLLSNALLIATIYWQMIPIMLATTGLSLDLKKLVVYPVPVTQLFSLEVILRVTTAGEILVLIAGAMAGTLRNSQLPWWGVLAFVPFVLINLFASAGIREVLLRVFARKVWREIAAILLVFVALLPQMVVAFGWSEHVEAIFGTRPSLVWPWRAAANLITGDWKGWPVPVLVFWIAASWWFGRAMFARSLRFDAGAAQASTAARGSIESGFGHRLRTLPSALLPDPLAAIVEKEFLSLVRSPRFRLLFLMGAFFSVIVLNTILHRNADAESWFSRNYLTLVSLYSLLFLGEICFWNSFAFDQAAAQAFFVMPVKLSQVLMAKNFASAVIIALELTAVVMLCAMMRLPMTPLTVAQAYAVCAVVGSLLIGAGNLTSVYFPRGVDPRKSLRSSHAGKSQMLALLLYPLAAAPAVLAYLAEYAFDSQLAFFGVILADLVLAGVIYAVCLESAVSGALNRREKMIQELSQTGGPVGG